MVKRIDSAHGPRLYEIPVDGGVRRVPSVTTVLGCMGKPQLVAWAAKVERRLVTEAAADLYLELPAVKMSRMAYLATLAKRIPLAKAHQLETERAFEAGRLAHEMVEWRLRSDLGHVPGPMPTLNKEAAFAFDAWQVWAESAEFRAKHIEEVLFSVEHGYAGTCDVVAEIEVDGQVVLAVGDWKTSKGIYDEHGLQVAAYAHALLEMKHAETMPYGFVARFPKTAADKPFETRVWTPEQLTENLEAFLGLLKVWTWQQGLKKEKKA